MTTSPRLADLVIPLATLLGLAERPGEGHGLGPLDPALCRELAIGAASSPYSRLCVTVTDPDGVAVGHGCARAGRRAKRTEPGRPLGLPARLNLTITAARLAELAAATGPPVRAPWGFTRDIDPGPPDGYGTWTLTLPGGGNLSVELRPVPTFACDKGGRTCACNAGARSRACHQVKQSPGGNDTQPQPGWHRWTTPSGRAYLQESKRYPA